MQITTIGLDLAKHWFQVHGVDAAGKPAVKRRLRRSEVVEFFKGLEPCLVGMEACATAHVYKVAKGTSNLIEEALANAFAYRAVDQAAFESFLSRKPGEGRHMQDACLRYLRNRFPKDPPGYKRALEFITNRDFEAGSGLLLAQIKQSNVRPVGDTRPDPILAAEIEPLFGRGNVRCVEVPDARVHRILSDGAYLSTTKARNSKSY
jgi:hypothetical protein